jgi:hypothetical protein
MPIMTDWRILEGAAKRARGLTLARHAGSDGRIKALLGECVAEIEADGLLTPVVAYETLPSEDIGKEHILLSGGARLDGVPALAADLAGARALVAAVATIGAGLEERASRLFANKDPLRAMLLEELGTAALFELSDGLQGRIEDAVCAGEERLSDPFQPGDGGFPLAHQRLLCALAGAERAGIRLSGAGMMVPVKSMSLLFGVGAQVPRRACADRCATCQARDRCRYRQSGGRELAA